MAPEKAQKFDLQRATLHHRDTFKPFRVRQTEGLGSLVERGVIHTNAPVLTLTQHDASLAFLTHQMNYHHLAQGELAGEPYLVSF